MAEIMEDLDKALLSQAVTVEGGVLVTSEQGMSGLPDKAVVVFRWNVIQEILYRNSACGKEGEQDV